MATNRYPYTDATAYDGVTFTGFVIRAKGAPTEYTPATYPTRIAATNAARALLATPASPPPAPALVPTPRRAPSTK